MKKYIINKFWILALLLAFGCTDPEDLVTEDAKDGGALLSVAGSEGKLLGIEDPATGIVDFTDNDLDLKVKLVNGQFNGESFTLVKKFGDEEIEIEDFSTLPFEYEISTVDEFLEGFSGGLTADDLRIGDVISFKVKIHTSDGRVVYSNDAQVNVTVNCGSDLEGTYVASGLLQRPPTIADQAIGPRTETLVKYGVNYYGTQNTAHWANADLGYEPCPVYFTITCGVIDIPSQNLCGAYGNVVSGTGYLDEDTGNIYLDYQVTGGDLRTVTLTYVKQ